MGDNNVATEKTLEAIRESKSKDIVLLAAAYADGLKTGQELERQKKSEEEEGND